MARRHLFLPLVVLFQVLFCAVMSEETTTMAAMLADETVANVSKATSSSSEAATKPTTTEATSSAAPTRMPTKPGTISTLPPMAHTTKPQKDMQTNSTQNNNKHGEKKNSASSFTLNKFFIPALILLAACAM